MNIGVFIYGILLLITTACLFYGITILVKEIFVRISKRRRNGHDNIISSGDCTEHNNSNIIGNNSYSAILNAKCQMRKKKHGK